MNQSEDLWKKIIDTGIIDEIYQYDENIKKIIIRILDRSDDNYIYESLDGLIENVEIKYICFFAACMFNNDTEIIKRLVDRYQIDVNQIDDRGQTGLSLACWKNTNIEVIKYLMENLRIDENFMNDNINVCLVLACGGNANLEIIKYLMEDQRLDKNYVTDEDDSDTCLTYACRENPNLHVIKYLIEDQGMDPKHLSDTNSCLGLACMRNTNLEIIKYLINDQKMDINHLNYNFDTCLTLACMGNNLDIIKYLVNDQKMNINHVNNNSDTCLTLACQHSTNIEVIKYLINDQKMNINHVNNNSDTCLTLACRHCMNIEVIKYLIEHHKMDAKHMNKQRQTCFTLVCRHHRNSALDVVQYLIESTDANISFEQCGFGRWKKIIRRITNTKNYDRLYDALTNGIIKYKYTYEKQLNIFLRTINPILLMDHMRIHGLDLMDPMDEKFKFEDYVKYVDNMTYIVPPLLSPASKNHSSLCGYKTSRFDHCIDFTQNPSLLFSHNGIKYYGHREIVYDSILCLREIKDIADFNELIELSSQAPSYIINLWINTMYTKQIDIHGIRGDSGDDIVLFLKHVDQYPTDILTIGTLEHDLIQYFDDPGKGIDQTQIDKHMPYLKELAHRYRLKRLYLWIHNKMRQ
jgi:NADH:ubiquinone oxidoreductase subunit E